MWQGGRWTVDQSINQSGRLAINQSFSQWPAVSDIYHFVYSGTEDLISHKTCNENQKSSWCHFCWQRWSCPPIDNKVGSIDGLVQDCSDSSALAMDLPQSCIKPFIYQIKSQISVQAHSLVVLHIVLVALHFLTDSFDTFTHIFQGCYAGTGTIWWLSARQQ